MLRKYLKLAYRNILNNIGLNSINIIGLAIGLMAVLLIFQYISFEKSYDRQFENSDRLYRLVFYRFYETGLDKSVGNNYFAGEIASKNIPEIENFCRCKRETQYVLAGEQIFKEDRTLFADSSFFDIFSHIVLSGDKSKFLRSPGVAIVTESTARKYFGNENPVGKIIYGVNPGKKPVTIQGVIKDTPQNSHLKFDLVISLSTLLNPSYCYTCNNTNTYFQLREESDVGKVADEITTLAKEFMAERKIPVDFPIEYHLQPVLDIHLHSNYRFEYEANGNNKYMIILSAIAFLILISAGLNYINLFSSIISRKIRGIGIRIVNGASSQDIVAEFTAEALLTGLISFILAFLLLFMLFPVFRDFLDLDFTNSTVFNIRTWIIPGMVIILLGIITGWFLGIRIYNIAPLSFIRKDFLMPGRKASRRILLVAQYIIAIILTGCTIGALKQISYMKKDAFTMDLDRTLVVKRPVAGEFNEAQKSFQETLLKYPGISEITFSTISPGEKNTWVKGGICLKGKENPGIQIFQADVAPDFFGFFGVKLLEGRNFYYDETNWDGGTRHLILNKEAVRALGTENLKEILGQTLYDTDMKEDIGEIVGVIDGYFQNSLDQEIKPTIFNCDLRGSYIFIRIRDADISDILQKVTAEFKSHFRDQYFEYYFLDDFFNSQYKSHVQLFRSFILFSLMAVVITVLSLFALVMQAAVSRTKEIGIRKLNGAKVHEILYMLNKEIIFIVTSAFLVAIPVIWYAIHKWLESFAYRTDITLWIFLAAGLCAYGIALLTVSWQSWRAATRNPVEALRYE